MKRLAACAALAAAAGLACAQERIITVGGGITEIAFALGAGARVVAADTTSTYPPAATRLPSVGYMRTLSAEGVLSLKPHLVLASSDAGPAPALVQIRSAGVPVTVLPNTHTFDSLMSNVRSTASALGLAKDGEQVTRRLQEDWSTTEAQVKTYRGRPRVLFLLAHSGTGTALAGGDETAANAMIRYAGAANAASGMKGYKPLTPEAVLGMAPDVVLITDEGITTMGGVERIWAQPGLALTPAGKNRRMVSMGAYYLLGFGPRLPQAVRDLAGKLHQP